MVTTATDEFTLHDVVAILKKRRWIVLKVLAMCALLAILFCLVATPRYQAEGILEVQQSSPDALDLQGLNGPNNPGGDALQANIDLQTQANVLTSDTLGISTIRALHLEATPDFRLKDQAPPVPSGARDAGPTHAANAAAGYSPKELNHYLQIFKGNLKVSPIGGTRLISVSYLSPDPKQAAEVVNTLLRGLVDYTFQTRLSATTQTSAWLTGQLTDLRKESEALQSKVVDLRAQTGVYSLGTADAQGREQSYSGVLDRLQQSANTLQTAEQNRILKGAIAEAVQNGNPEALSSLAGNTSGQMNSMSVLQALRQQEASQQAALVEAESKYGSAYPQVLELRANITGLERTITQETDRIRNRAVSDYHIAIQTEAGVRAQYEQARQQAAGVNQKAVQFTIVKQEADQSRQLYEDLLKRLKEADILGGLRSSNLLVVDAARVPTKAKSPDKLLILGLGVGMGLVLGCILAFIVDLLDDRIYNVDDARQAAGVPDVLSIPFPGIVVGSDQEALININEPPSSNFLEAVRRLQVMLLWPGEHVGSQVVQVTSPEGKEGAAIVAHTLAAVLAQAGKRVLLVDTITDSLEASRRPGLRTELASAGAEAPIARAKGHSNLDVLVTNNKYSLTAMLLHRGTFQKVLTRWRSMYDFIILLVPPVLSFSDAVLVNQEADLTLLLSRQQHTSKKTLAAASRSLTEMRVAHPLKVVLMGEAVTG